MLQIPQTVQAFVDQKGLEYESNPFFMSGPLYLQKKTAPSPNTIFRVLPTKRHKIWNQEKEQKVAKICQFCQILFPNFMT